MHPQLLDAYLTHYQPDLRAELLARNSLSSYLESQNQAMREAKTELLRDLRQRFPDWSPLQQEMEAEQQIREMFLPVS